jgi:hypothetical protein
MYEYTPGPWETVAGPTDGDLAVCEPEGGDEIAIVTNGSICDRDLIAAAPELLEACQAALPALSAHEQTGCDCPDSDAARLLRAAIAKVENA